MGRFAQQWQQGIQDGIGDESVGQGVEITARIGEQPEGHLYATKDQTVTLRAQTSGSS